MANGLLALVARVTGGALWLGARIDPALPLFALPALLPGLLAVLAMLCLLDSRPGALSWLAGGGAAPRTEAGKLKRAN